MKLLAEEVFKDNFDLVDTDRDGFISKDETGLLFRGLGQTISDTDLNKILNTLDSNKIDFEKFKTFFITHYKVPTSQNELIDAFKVFDPTNSGKITVARFRELVTKLGDSLTEQEVDEVLKESRIDPRGTIDYISFSALISASPKSAIN